MLTEIQKNNIIKNELTFQTSRSGGKGGQNVNKVETKVELEFDVETSQNLDEQQKERIKLKYDSFINGSVIKLSASKHRSQLQNKEEAANKLFSIIDKLLKTEKKRKPTRPSKSSKEKKLFNKKIKSEIKTLRQKFR